MRGELVGSENNKKIKQFKYKIYINECNKRFNNGIWDLWNYVFF